MAGLFTREGLPPLQTMDEMQCMWFQTEMALAFRRIGKLGNALQKLHEIEKVQNLAMLVMGNWGLMEFIALVQPLSSDGV